MNAWLCTGAAVLASRELYRYLREVSAVEERRVDCGRPVRDRRAPGCLLPTLAPPDNHRDNQQSSTTPNITDATSLLRHNNNDNYVAAAEQVFTSKQYLSSW